MRIGWKLVDIPERGTSVGISSFSGETSNAFRRMKDRMRDTGFLVAEYKIDLLFI